MLIADSLVRGSRIQASVAQIFSHFSFCKNVLRLAYSNVLFKKMLGVIPPNLCAREEGKGDGTTIKISGYAHACPLSSSSSPTSGSHLFRISFTFCANLHMLRSTKPSSLRIDKLVPALAGTQAHLWG